MLCHQHAQYPNKADRSRATVTGLFSELGTIFCKGKHCRE